MIEPALDDASPLLSRRRIRVGLLEDHHGWSYVVTTDDRATWLLEPDHGRVSRFPSDGMPGQSWPLLVADWLETDRALRLIVTDEGVEQRIEGGTVTTITAERAPKR